MVSLKDFRCGASAAVSDMPRARQFYEGVLGLVPGTDTGDNGFDVDDVEAVVDQLTAQGVTFERYDEPPIVTDAKGIAHFEGDAKVAYFKDPDGNILSLAQAPG